MMMPVVLAFSITAAILVPLRSAFGACANQQRAARGPLASPSAVADQPSVVIRVRCYEGKRSALYRNPELENTICQQWTPAGAVTQTAQLLLQGRLVSVLHQSFAHEVDMISQHVQHARISGRHSETVCLFLQAIKPRSQFTRVAPGVAGVRHLVLQKPQFSVH